MTLIRFGNRTEAEVSWAFTGKSQDSIDPLLPTATFSSTTTSLDLNITSGGSDGGKIVTSTLAKMISQWTSTKHLNNIPGELADLGTSTEMSTTAHWAKNVSQTYMRDEIELLPQSLPLLSHGTDLPNLNFNDFYNISYDNFTDLNKTETGIEEEIHYNYWALLLILFSLFAVFGNMLVILSVKRERSLWNVTNYFIVSLAVADLLVAGVVMPFGVYFLVRDFPTLLLRHTIKETSSRRLHSFAFTLILHS